MKTYNITYDFKENHVGFDGLGVNLAFVHAGVIFLYEFDD